MDINEFRGTLRVSNEAVCEIAAAAACEVEGVVCTKRDINVKYSGGAAETDVALCLKKGAKATVCAEAVQNKVRDSIQCMTGITVSRVNVKIYGMV